ncbi:hypothetical protein F383_20962 [Gossypium arboreum]|uniref:Uncharacterized protein n=1 Tax=Gossypium arboreum TaxID=29729 RepID=A0A0B0NSG9_GOSAR|nr:hypothetical protein F383_20962 [Gossypium arboreum]
MNSENGMYRTTPFRCWSRTLWFCINLDSHAKMAYIYFEHSDIIILYVVHGVLWKCW